MEWSSILMEFFRYTSYRNLHHEQIIKQNLEWILILLHLNENIYKNLQSKERGFWCIQMIWQTAKMILSILPFMFSMDWWTPWFCAVQIQCGRSGRRCEVHDQCQVRSLLREWTAMLDLSRHCKRLVPSKDWMRLVTGFFK